MLLKNYDKWEGRIKILEGLDYRRLSVKIYDKHVVEFTGKEGCRYFEATKDLT